MVSGALLLAGLAESVTTVNVSLASACSVAHDVCSCADLAPGCGWCSSTKMCSPADECTTTCRECPHTHKTCRKSCRRKCINTCVLAQSVCGCTELEGCGWCSHGSASSPFAPGSGHSLGTCQPYPECSTTCEECDPKCHTHKHCKASCYPRFRTRPVELVNNVEKIGLFPIGQKDINCGIAVFAATVLASAAGIGGGAVLVPLFTMLGEFTEHEAIPLSIATVFGASTYSALGNYIWQKHPVVRHRHQIAYDVVLVLLPSTLLGSTAGVFLNKVCPNWLIMLLLVLLCGYSGKRTLSKGFQQWAKESRAQSSGEYAAVAQKEGEEMRGGVVGAAAFDSGGVGHADELQAEHEAETVFPWGTLLLLLRCWVAVMFLSLLKGGHGAPSVVGAACGTVGYWGLVALNLPVLGYLTHLAGLSLLKRHKRLVAMGYEYAEGDVAWDADKARRYPMIVAVGAIAAGMLGVGGGMILGPIFLELGIIPQVSSATSTVMVMFMSSANMGQFIVLGMLDLEYACYYGAIGIVGAIVGTGAAKKLIEMSGRASFLIFFLAVILLGSGLLMVVTGTPQIIKSGLTGFRPVCGRAGAAARSD